MHENQIPQNFTLSPAFRNFLGIKKRRKILSPFCTPSGTRTLDPLIKSQLLYQLSYQRIALTRCTGTALF